MNSSEKEDKKYTDIELRTINSEGVRLLQRNQYDKAIQNFKQVLIESEKDKQALCGRSLCHKAKGDAIAAVVDAENALTQDRNYPPVIILDIIH